MKKLLTIAVALVVTVALPLTALEVRHRSKYGHFFPLRLHADVTDFRGDIGKGSAIFFDAHLTNFGLYPREIETCEFISDANAHQVSVAYRLERLDDRTQRWQTILDSTQNFCSPYPLSIAQARLVRKTLWIGQTLSTGARTMDESDILNGNTMRFVIQTNGLEFPTGSFAIVTVYRP